MASDNQYWIGFDLGGTKMMAAVLDKKFKILASCKKKMKAYRGVSQGLQGIAETIKEAMQEAHVEPQQLAGIGIGCPGVLDLNRGVVVQAPNLGWRNVELQKTLEKTFKCPAVIANDVDAGTLGEFHFGAGRKARCVLGIFPGTGIGGGCVYDGKLIRGTTGSCMEIGHVHVQPKGRLCGCGRRGCLETVASRLAISAEAAAAAYRGAAPNLLKISGTDLTAIRSGSLAEAIKAGDDVIEEIVRHAARQLGIATASIVNLLAPDVVVLGGGLVEALPKIFVEEVRVVVQKQAMQPFRSTKIVAAQLGDDAVVLGAAALVAEHVG